MVSTRPFLEDIEKKWLAYQLLCAVRDSHARNVYHGDIKTENILVTSWNWLYLADYSSSFKKTYLPEDNPADFSYFFDTSGRRTCYIAPERFSESESKSENQDLTWAMDVFSVGCVIAEIFLEAPIFTLSQLFKYRRSEFDPKLVYIEKIQDDDIREMVSHMIQLDPEARYTAEEYLRFWRHKAFPDYFTGFLHQYMGLMTDPSSGREPVLPETESFGEADQRIERVFHDFDKISYFLRHKPEIISNGGRGSSNITLPIYLEATFSDLDKSELPANGNEDGSLIFLSLVAASLRHSAHATSKIRACDLMLAFATKISDEAKLDRVLPYVITLLGDKSDLVKVAALRTVTQILSLIRVVSPVNASVFTEYVRPRLASFIAGSGVRIKPFVRATYASSLASLAHSSMRILDMVQTLRAEGSIPTIDPEAEDEGDPRTPYGNVFDLARTDLLDFFEGHTKALLIDKDPSVRRALLGSVSSLCVFFGTVRASDVVLTHLNTYVNDSDWMLRCAFFQTLVGVATFVGGTSVEEYLLPLMIQALSDAEELVTEKVVTSLGAMAQLGLFQPATVWEIVGLVGRFLIHPNPWIRAAAVTLVASSTTHLPLADIHTFVAPLLAPYLKFAVLDYTANGVMDRLKRPLSRPVMEMSITWAAGVKDDSSKFWRSVNAPSSVDRNDGGSFPPGKTKLQSLNRTPTNPEDDQWIQKLRNLGLTPEDEPKFLSLREYIWHCSRKRKSAGETKSDQASSLNNIQRLKERNVTPQTVFFEERKIRHDPRRRHSEDPRLPSEARRKKPITIADALLDASENLEVNGKARKFDSQQSSRDASLRPPSIASSGRPASGHGKSPTDVLKREAAHGLRHKSSAIQLLRDHSKAAAETGTSSENAFGDLEAPKHQAAKPTSRLRSPKRPSRKETYLSHTYNGNDPTVMKLLDGMTSEGSKPEDHDFGPSHYLSRSLPSSRDANDVRKPWRPEGVLVATFGEHTGPINRVLVSPDHTFFITGSDDGTVKIWDTIRLERNISYRSRQTYKHSESGHVRCLTFVGNTHTFASGASDGSIHLVKVEYSQSGDSSRYGRLKTLRSYRFPEGEHPLWMETHKASSPSSSYVLIACTNLSRVVTLDLRDMSTLYTFTNPLHHGTPLCFCISHKHDWLLLGTSRGVLDFWDLRFRLRLKSWGWPGQNGKPIRRVAIYPYRGKGKWVSVLGGTAEGELTIWDLDKWICREVFRTVGPSTQPPPKSKAYEMNMLDEDGALGTNPTSFDQFLTSTTITTAPHTDDSAALPSPSPNNSTTLRALTFFTDHPEEGNKHRENKHGFLLTGGHNRKLHIWDVPRFDTDSTTSNNNPSSSSGSGGGSSKILSGLDVEEQQPKFTTTQVGNVVVHTEKLSGTGQGQGGGATATAGMGKKKGEGEKIPRNTLISLQQQNLLRRHMDSITDVAILERPTMMSVSVDRAGAVYVFE